MFYLFQIKMDHSQFASLTAQHQSHYKLRGEVSQVEQDTCFFFSIADRLKTSPNLRYFSNKSPTAGLFYNDFTQHCSTEFKETFTLFLTTRYVYQKG
jgi:hypothetical protein